METNQKNNKNKVLIIDTFYYLHRSFHAFPITMQTVEGRSVNILFGFTKSVIDLIITFKPTHIVFSWETMSQPSFRRDIYKQYQANRALSIDPEKDEAFKNQLPLIYEAIETFGTKEIYEDGFEGDDIIGTFATKAHQQGSDVIIASNDQDLMQLINDNISVYNSGRPPFIKSKLYDHDSFLNRYGFEPETLIDYKALRGDPSDNIPGVKGIGDKYAKQLLDKYQNLNNIYYNLDNIESKSIRKKLTDNKDMAYLSYQLATIITDIPIDIKINDYKIDLNISKLNDFNRKWEFRSLMKKTNVIQKIYDLQKQDNKNQISLL